MKTRALQKAFNKLAKQAKKHSPEILLGVGVIGSVAAVVEAAVQTPKALDILDEHKKLVEKCKEAKEKEPEKYTQKDYAKDLTGIYIRTTGKLALVYAPAILTEAGALTCIFASHHIMSERNKTLAAALTTVSEAYARYRERVIEKYGKEADEEIRFGTHKEKIEVEEADENGKVKKKKENVNISDPRLIHQSLYARIFDENCHGYEKNREFRYKYLNDVENWLNEKLNMRGKTNPKAKLFLSEVYKELDINDKEGHGESSPEARVMCWKYDPDNPHKILLNAKDMIVKMPYTPERYARRENPDAYTLVTIIDPNVECVDPDILG